MPFELGQAPDRPNICIGTDNYHTPGWLTDRAIALFQKTGYSVEVNRPYSGSIVPRDYYQTDRRVASIMIEINRGLYMDAVSGQKIMEFKSVKGSIAAVVPELKSEFVTETVEQ
jgi:N-formylglutamate deformylase